MEFGSIIQAFAALIFVVVLMALLASYARRYGTRAGLITPTNNAQKRLQIVASAGIDAKRRVVLIRRDKKEHLLLISEYGDQVIEGDITPPKDTKE